MRRTLQVNPSVEPAVEMRALLLASFLASIEVSSEFAKYPAEGKLVGKPAPINMHLPDARKFRTVLRNEAARGPNFNGRYRIAYWGQGTGVIMWAVINLATGQVWFAPEGAGICPGTDLEDDGLEYFESHTDSSLFYLHTCSGKLPMNRVHNSREVYIWREGAAVLMREESLK